MNSIAAAAGAGNGTMIMVIYMIVIVAIFYFLLIRPQRNEQKRVSAMLSNLEVGDSVVTTSGFYGVVLDVTEEDVIVEFGNNKNCRIPMRKTAIAEVEKADSAVDSTAGSTWMGSKAPLLDISADKVVDFETVVMTIPQFDPTRQRMISQGPSVCMFNKPDRQEVLASWLFLQYLLSNDVQIAYAETEGYVPVTLKAQQSEEYQDYLSRIGEDNDLHYDVKILASKLLLSHTGDTFVTPVFNGSASLRDAAGQMIENVTKSVRRKEAVNDAYYEKLYADMVSLYHLNLDGTGASAAARQDLGPLPHTAVVLLSSLACAWVLIALYFCLKQFKKRKAEHS